MGSPEDPASLHGQPLTAENLQQSQELDSVSQVINEVLNPHGRLPLAEVGIDPVDEGLALYAFLFI